MSDKDWRRNAPTAENKQEAARLMDLWEQTKRDRAQRGVGSQAAFAHEYEIGSQSAVAHFLSGRTPLSLAAASKFAKGLGCKIEDFSPRLAAEMERLASVADAPDPLSKLDGTEGHLIGLFRAYAPRQRMALMKEAERLRDGGEPLPVEAYHLAKELLLLKPDERQVAYSLALSAIEHRDMIPAMDLDQLREDAAAEAQQDQARKPSAPAASRPTSRRAGSR